MHETFHTKLSRVHIYTYHQIRVYFLHCLYLNVGSSGPQLILKTMPTELDSIKCSMSTVL